MRAAIHRTDSHRSPRSQPRFRFACLLFGFVAACATPEPGTLRLRTTDESGKPLPSYIAFQDLDRDEWRTVAQPFLPNQQEDKRSRRPQWRGRQPIHCNGEAVVSLPPGRYRVVAGKGVEYSSTSDNVTIESGREATVDLPLRRWVDMPARGWWSGDTHVHITRADRSANQPILWAAQAEDVHVSNLLEMGDIETVVWPQYAWGEEGVAREGDHWLVVGQEEPRTHQIGHAVMLDIPHLIRDTEHYYLYDRIFRRAKELGGLAGVAHFLNGKFHSERSADMLFPAGLVDFVELLDNNNKLRPQSYYDALNLGFRPSLVAGSDFPWGSHIGDQRVFVYVDPGQPFTLRRWFDGIRQGRTFVTQGPLVEMQVDAQPLGSEIRVSRGATIKVTASASAPTDIGAPKKLSLISMGQELHTVESADPTRERLELEFPLTVERSLWVSAVVEAHNGAAAHTSAIYVVVDEKPVVADGAPLEWALRRARERLQSIRDPAFVPAGDARREFTAAVDQALAFYSREPYAPLPR